MGTTATIRRRSHTWAAKEAKILRVDSWIISRRGTVRISMIYSNTASTWNLNLAKTMFDRCTAEPLLMETSLTAQQSAWEWSTTSPPRVWHPVRLSLPRNIQRKQEHRRLTRWFRTRRTSRSLAWWKAMTCSKTQPPRPSRRWIIRRWTSNSTAQWIQTSAQNISMVPKRNKRNQTTRENKLAWRRPKQRRLKILICQTRNCRSRQSRQNICKTTWLNTEKAWKSRVPSRNTCIRLKNRTSHIKAHMARKCHCQKMKTLWWMSWVMSCPPHTLAVHRHHRLLILICMGKCQVSPRAPCLTWTKHIQTRVFRACTPTKTSVKYSEHKKKETGIWPQNQNMQRTRSTSTVSKLGSLIPAKLRKTIRSRGQVRHRPLPTIPAGRAPSETSWQSRESTTCSSKWVRTTSLEAKFKRQRCNSNKTSWRIWSSRNKNMLIAERLWFQRRNRRSWAERSMAPTRVQTVHHKT